jgi:hypothetical protein
MNLTPGTRLGPYEITAPLGAGGMGEVFRATDSRLGRDVAVKVLPKHLSANPEVCARFEREAKTVSSLNHPHICTLFDVGREADTDYLVMELVEGETLAQRLEKGALPVADVLELGGQIADALDQAHRAGVIHRDLKPGNVMLTKSGAKLMDFGLARATGMTGPGSGSGVTVAALTQSPTVAQPLTAEGTIVGTFLYMAPEQLEGSEADARSDLWALGCVLYEMATGKRAFEGKSPASIISSIMGSQPAPISQLAPLAPPGLERLVQACLAKDPAERLQSAHDIRMQLAWLAEGGSQAGVPAPVAARRRSRERLAWILAAVGMIAVVALAVLLAAPSFFLPGSRTTEDPGRVVRFEVTAPPGTRMSGGIGHVISPEGTALLWPGADSEGRPRRWIRRLDSLESSALPPMVSGACFWSPDGASIGFINDDKLRTMSIDGGVPRTVCEAVSYRGASWGAEYIVFAGGQGPIFKVPVTGGIPEAVTALDESRGETAHRFPYFLPDGETFLYVALPGKHRVLEVYAGHVDGREPVFVTNSLISPVYASGHLIFQRGRRLLAQVFDPDALALSGKPVDLGPAPTLWEGAGATKVSASRNGTLAYLTPEDPSTRLVWKDPTSENSIEDLGTLDLEPGAYKEVEFSPDGHHVALVREVSPEESDIWVLELDRGILTRCLQTAPGSATPPMPTGLGTSTGSRFPAAAPRSPSSPGRSRSRICWTGHRTGSSCCTARSVWGRTWICGSRPPTDPENRAPTRREPSKRTWANSLPMAAGSPTCRGSPEGPTSISTRFPSPAESIGSPSTLGGALRGRRTERESNSQLPAGSGSKRRCRSGRLSARGFPRNRSRSMPISEARTALRTDGFS